jgi:hypothetical protein
MAIMIPYRKVLRISSLSSSGRWKEVLVVELQLMAVSYLATPHNAFHIQIDPLSEKVSFVGPRLEGVL